MGSAIRFRELRREDLQRAIAILAAAEPEDADDAAAALRDDPADRFVLVRDTGVVGVTGFRAIPDTDGSYLLGWTAIDPAAGDGAGDTLIGGLGCALAERHARKLFTTIADGDVTPGSTVRRGGARAFYEALGFETETRHRDYYAPGDSATVLGFRLLPAGAGPGAVEDPGRIRILDADEIPETDDAYAVAWNFADDAPPSSREEIEGWLARLAEWEARIALAGIPSHAEAARRQLEEAGFREEGRLRDLVEDGIDEVRMRIEPT